MMNGFLMGIPDEMWEKILTKTRMESSDMANFRSVNIKCNALADNLFDRWVIKIDDRYENDEKRGPYLETLFDLRIEELNIVRLVDPLPFRPPEVILKYPNMLKVIKTEYWFNPNVDRKGISPENLHILLKSKNLEKMDMKLVGADLNSPVYLSEPPLIGYDFSKLQMMTICISHYGETPLELIQGNLIQRILKTSIFSNLNCLDITFEFDHTVEESENSSYQMHCDVLEFIVKYGHTLKTVKSNIFGWPDEDHDFPSFLESIDESQLEICSNLDSLNVDSRFLQDTWRSLLGLQNKLFHWTFDEISIKMSLFTRVIQRNCNTLTSIDLIELEVDEVLVDGIAVRIFDFEIFSNCSNLRKLSLSATFFLCEGRNLSRLHEKIEFLNLHNFEISREELLMFSSNRVQLESLDLTHVGSMGSFGVTGLVLENFLALSNLTSLKVRGNSFNRSDPDETVKLETILDNLGRHPAVELIWRKRNLTTDSWYR